MISDEQATELVKRFVKEACVIDPDAVEPQVRLFDDFKYWTIRKAGLKLVYPFYVSKPRFTNILVKLGFEKKNGGGPGTNYSRVYIWGLKSLLSDRL